jgi:hypothetical protein
MKAYWGSGGIALRILDLEVGGQLQATEGKSPWYPLDRRLGGPQSRSGRGGEEKNSQPLPGFEPPIIHPVTQCHTTEPARLLYLKGTAQNSPAEAQKDDENPGSG